MRKNKKMIIRILAMTITILLISSNIVMCTDTAYVWSTDTEATVETNATEESKEISSNSLNLESTSAILIEQHTGKVLYAHNEHELLRPASVTKVMTLLLIMEAVDSGQISLTDQISCSTHASSMGGSQIWLDTTETLSVHEMLKAICVVSANDCTVAMAEHLAGSEETFVERMNQRAKELGMNDTTFKNCHGIDEDGHFTSAYDIALMSKELLNNHLSITEYTTIWMDSLRDGKSELVNTNKLVRNYSGATGLKTGSTSLALYNLSASATRNNLSLIAVVMKSATSAIRFEEAQKLLDYGFANYSYKEFGTEGEVVKTVTVSKGVKKEVNAIFEKGAYVLMKKGQESKVTQEISIEDSITAPIEKGDKLGEVKYSIDGEIIATVDIVAEKSIKKTNLWNMTTYIYEKWFNVVR